MRSEDWTLSDKLTVSDFSCLNLDCCWINAIKIRPAKRHEAPPGGLRNISRLKRLHTAAQVTLNTAVFRRVRCVETPLSIRNLADVKLGKVGIRFMHRTRTLCCLKCHAGVNFRRQPFRQYIFLPKTTCLIFFGLQAYGTISALISRLAWGCVILSSLLLVNCQCLPVLRHGDRVQVVESPIKNNVTWPLFRQLQLVKNMRTTQGSQEYADWLIQLGNGTLPQLPSLNDPELFEIPPDFLDVPSNLVDQVFGHPSKLLNPGVAEKITTRAILFPKNVDVLTKFFAIICWRLILHFLSHMQPMHPVHS